MPLIWLLKHSHFTTINIKPTKPRAIKFTGQKIHETLDMNGKLNVPVLVKFAVMIAVLVSKTIGPTIWLQTQWA